MTVTVLALPTNKAPKPLNMMMMMMMMTLSTKVHYTPRIENTEQASSFPVPCVKEGNAMQCTLLAYLM